MPCSEATISTSGRTILATRMPTEETWGLWAGVIKEATGAKGKSLFMPLRKALTGMDHGPSMQNLLVLIGETRARARLNGEKA